MAAPLGPPPSVAITCTLPSGVTRDSARRSISTRITEPSSIATGPSGKRRPEAICLSAGTIVFNSASWAWSRSLLGAWAQGARVLGRPGAQQLATSARGRLARGVEKAELERRGHRWQRLHVEPIQRDRRVIGFETGAPVGHDVVVGQVHAADARQHRADAVARDHR